LTSSHNATLLYPSAKEASMMTNAEVVRGDGVFGSRTRYCVRDQTKMLDEEAWCDADALPS
jgi:hypothetical protein